MRYLLSFLLASLALASYAQDATGPEAVVRTFLAAVNKGDFTAAAKLIKGGKVGSFLSEPSMKGQLPQVAIDQVVVTMAGERALVIYNMTASMPGQPGVAVGTEYLVLVHEGQDWLIDPPMHEIGLSFMAFMLTDPPMFEQAHTAAQAVACLSNVKQLALGILMFEADNDDVLKVTAANWTSKIMPYLKNKALFTCPLDPKGTVSYSINTKLIGKSDAAISELASTVLVYEGKDGKLNFHHDGKAAVAFADGHAKLVTEAEAKNLHWSP